MAPHCIQSTPVISHQLVAKIRVCELSGSPVISCSRVKAKTRDLLDYRLTLWRLQLPNSMLSENKGGCIYQNFTQIDIVPVTNHNKPY